MAWLWMITLMTLWHGRPFSNFRLTLWLAWNGKSWLSGGSGTNKPWPPSPFASAPEMALMNSRF
jgi:hypothetical protein